MSKLSEFWHSVVGAKPHDTSTQTGDGADSFSEPEAPVAQTTTIRAADEPAKPAPSAFAAPAEDRRSLEVERDGLAEERTHIETELQGVRQEATDLVNNNGGRRLEEGSLEAALRRIRDDPGLRGSSVATRAGDLLNDIERGQRALVENGLRQREVERRLGELDREDAKKKKGTKGGGGSGGTQAGGKTGQKATPAGGHLKTKPATTPPRTGGLPPRRRPPPRRPR